MEIVGTDTIELKTDFLWGENRKFTNYKFAWTWAEWLDIQDEAQLEYADRKDREDEYDELDDQKYSDIGDWAGTRSLWDAYKLAQLGWQTPITEAKSFVHRVTERVLTDALVPEFKSTYDVQGASVDIGRYVSGEPECMQLPAPFKVSKKGRAVRLAIPYYTSCATNQELIVARGKAVLGLTEALAMAGHPLDLWMIGATCSNECRLVKAVEVQRADQPLDMARVMFAVAHPSMLRRLAFKWTDKILDDQEVPSEWRRAIYYVGSPGYGASPYDVHESDLPPRAQTEGSCIVLPDLQNSRGQEWNAEQWASSQNWRNEEWCINWVEYMVKQIVEA